MFSLDHPLEAGCHDFRGVQELVSGGHGGGDTPGPMPNPAVKPSSVDGTAVLTVGE